MAMKTILLVEDEPSLIELLHLVLSKEGFHVHCMEKAEDALEFCLATTPDMIICDIRLGGMDGLSFLQAVRGNAQLQQVPFVVVSAMNDASFVRIAKEFGATAYFSKPFDTKELVGVVKRILSPHMKHEKSVSLWPTV